MHRGYLMATIADLIRLEITPEELKRRKPKVTEIKARQDCPVGAKPDRKYEYEVFNFLLDNKDTLGIETVLKFKNLRVDGAILLNGRKREDRKRLAIEIKLRMNWLKACQA